MKINITLLLILGALSSCVSTKEIQLNTNDSVSLRGKSVTINSIETTPFKKVTPINIMLGVIAGPFSMFNSGKRIVKDNNIQDPATMTGEILSDELKNSYGVKIVSTELSETADYILEPKTVMWGIHYTRTLDYVIVYSSSVRLIDTSNSKTIAEGSCSYSPYNSYKKNAFLIENAKLLKSEIAKAATECSNLFKKTVLNIH